MTSDEIDFHDDAHPEAKEITGDANYGEWGQCVTDSSTTGERCRGHAKGPHGKCHSHGGSTPTKEENPKQGNGDQDENGNAITHGSTADPTNLYKNLDDVGKKWVDEKVNAYLDAKGLERNTPDGDLVELAVMSLYQARSAHGVLFNEGLSRTAVKGTTEHGAVTDEEEHYLNRVVSQHTSDYRMALKDAGALNDPESKRADATNSLAKLLSGDSE